MSRPRALPAPLLAVLTLAAAGQAQDPPSEVRELHGTLLLDGRPWPHGSVRLLPVDDRTWSRARGEAIEVVADAHGEFVAPLTGGPWRVYDTPTWPEGASLRCDLREAPHAPGRGIVWVGHATTCRALVYDEDTPLELDVLSPLVVTGRVVDATGSPAPGTQVRAVRPRDVTGDEPAATVTGCEVEADGAFRLLAPAWLAGHPRAALVARAPGHGLAAARLGLVLDGEGGVTAPSPAMLTLADAPLRCRGVVEDLDGRRVARARVTGELRLVDARHPDDLIGVPIEIGCDEAGEFTFEAVGGSGWRSPGPFFAVVELDAAAPGLEGGEDVVFGPGLESVVRVQRTDLPLAGVVIDEAGSPIAGATVRAGRAEAEVDAEGRFALRAAERCDLVVSAPHHTARALRARLPLTDLVVLLSPIGPPIVGRLLDAAGRPLTGKEVQARPMRQELLAAPPLPAIGAAVDLPLEPSSRPLASAVTGADGSFELRDLPAGVDVVVDAVAHPGLVAQAGARVTLALAPETLVLATAVRAEDGAPLPVSWHLGVTAGRHHLSATAEGDRLVHTVRWPGEVFVSASAPGRLVVRRGPFTADGGTIDLGALRLPLHVPGGVRLTVRWPDVPLDGLTVEWTDPDGTARGDWYEPARTPASTWLIDGLAPGTVELRFTALTWDHRQLGPVEKRLELAAGAETAAELDLRGLR